MGGVVAKCLPTSKRPAQICMLGLDGAGKTTVLYRLQSDKFVTTTPTVGFNVEVVNLDGLSFAVWDIGGQEKIRQLWKHYLRSSKAIIFVIDSNDTDRLNEAQEELHSLVDYCEMVNPILLVLINKQDLPNARSPKYVSDHLKLSSLDNWLYYCQPISAINGEGLKAGINWLGKQLKS